MNKTVSIVIPLKIFNEMEDYLKSESNTYINRSDFVNTAIKKLLLENKKKSD